MSCSLYRFYDADDRLLYVGITSRVPSRLSQHARDKEWFPYVARASFEHYQHRDDAALAEKKTIKRERPLYNLAHVPDDILRPGEVELEDVASHLRVDPDVVNRWAAFGRIPHRRCKDGTLVFHRQKIDAWLRSLRREPEAS